MRQGSRWLVIIIMFGALGCEDSVVPAGPANCEPPEELVLERKLKEGYRAAAEGSFEDADIAFRSALEIAPEHPEALAGRRLLKDLLRKGGRPMVPPASDAKP